MKEEPIRTPKQLRAARIRHALLRFGFIFFLFASAVLYLWKSISEDKLREEYLATQNQTLDLAESVTAHETQAALVALGDAVAAVVRRMMQNGDLAGVSSYFRALKNSERVIGITLMRNDGKIMVATDRRREGASMSNMFRNTTSRLPGVYIDGTKDDSYLVLIPIEGPATRLGLVILHYQRLAFDDLMSLERSRK